MYKRQQSALCRKAWMGAASHMFLVRGASTSTDSTSATMIVMRKSREQRARQ